MFLEISLLKSAEIASWSTGSLSCSLLNWTSYSEHPAIFRQTKKKGRSATWPDRKPTQSPGASNGELWGIKTNRWCSSTISVDVPQRKLGSKRQNPGAFRQKRRQSTLWQFNIAMEIHHHPSSYSMGHLYHTKCLNQLPSGYVKIAIENGHL
jgi:hypothetical protein